MQRLAPVPIRMPANPSPGNRKLSGSASAAKEMAARASMYTPALIPASAAKAVNREAQPAYLPCRLSRAITGGPEGGASPARAVVMLVPLARQSFTRSVWLPGY